MRKPCHERDEMLNELQNRFKQGFFRKSENLNRAKKAGIFVAYDTKDYKGLPIVTENCSMHPDFEVIIDKYEAWLEPSKEELGFWIFIKSNLHPKKVAPQFNLFRFEILNALKLK